MIILFDIDYIDAEFNIGYNEIVGRDWLAGPDGNGVWGSGQCPILGEIVQGIIIQIKKITIIWYYSS